MKKFVISLIVLIAICFTSALVCIFSYYNGIKAVSSDNTSIDFNVKEGSNFYSIASELKEAGLIKSEFYYKIFIKFNKPSKIQSGVFKLNKNMSVKEIIDTLQGRSTNPNAFFITFKEGYDMRDIITQITEKTENTQDDIINTLKDANYLNSLIDKYWFIDNSILNPDLYYSLEGYLYPETYQFDSKQISVQEIFNVMISQLDKQLPSYKSNIENSTYSFHQLLALASIVELEGKKVEDRSGIAGVFYNRLNTNMNLGSDVTTYYGAKVKMSDRDLYMDEINDNNPYNTRSNSMIGKLPVGPICNPSIESISAVLNPEKSDNYYFVSDKNGQTYFSKNLADHNNTIAKLKREGLWYEY